MKPEGSLPHFQAPATCPYPEGDQSSQLTQYNTSEILNLHQHHCTILISLKILVIFH